MTTKRRAKITQHSYYASYCTDVINVGDRDGKLAYGARRIKKKKKRRKRHRKRAARRR